MRHGGTIDKIFGVQIFSNAAREKDTFPVLESSGPSSHTHIHTPPLYVCERLPSPLVVARAKHVASVRCGGLLPGRGEDLKLVVSLCFDLFFLLSCFPSARPSVRPSVSFVRVSRGRLFHVSSHEISRRLFASRVFGFHRSHIGILRLRVLTPQFLSGPPVPVQPCNCIVCTQPNLFWAENLFVFLINKC